VVRLRLGIILIIISWLPIAQVFLAIAHGQHKLSTNHESEIFRLVVWIIQTIIGLIGLLLAGKIAIQEAKKEGWKQTPNRIWRLFWSSSN
jgi:hypothetical protein